MDSYLKILVNDKALLWEMVADFLAWCKTNDYPVDETSWVMYYES